MLIKRCIQLYLLHFHVNQLTTAWISKRLSTMRCFHAPEEKIELAGCYAEECWIWWAGFWFSVLWQSEFWRIFWKTQNFPLYSETFVEKSHYYGGPVERLGDWPSLRLPNRQVRVKWNRGPCWVTSMILDHRGIGVDPGNKMKFAFVHFCFDYLSGKINIFLKCDAWRGQSSWRRPC